MVPTNICPPLGENNVQHGCRRCLKEKAKLETNEGVRRDRKQYLEWMEMKARVESMDEEEKARKVAEVEALMEANKAEIQAMPQFHHYTHVKVSSKWDLESRKVDCGMVMCDYCLAFEAITYAGNREFRCPKRDEESILDDWEASIQINIDKEDERKGNLEKLLATKIGGKVKIKAVLEFLRDTRPFPSDFFDMAMEEGMPEKEESESEEVESESEEEESESEEEEEARADQECSLM